MTHTHAKSQDQRLIAFKSYSRNNGRTDTTDCYTLPKAALTGKHDTLVRRAPCQPGALRIHLTRLSTEGLGPRYGEVRRAHQMLNVALRVHRPIWRSARSTDVYVSRPICETAHFVNWTVPMPSS